MTKFIFSILVLISVSSLQVSAQLIPLLVNNRDNAPLVNPSMTGLPMLYEGEKMSRDQIKSILSFNSRLQWTQFKAHSPLTHFFKYSFKPSFADGGSKFGWFSAFAMSDRVGPFRTLTPGINASYHIKLGSDNYVHFGLNVRATQVRLDPNGIMPLNSGDEIVTENVNQYRSNPWFFNSGGGFFYSSKTFYGGFSVPNLVFPSSDEIAGGSRHFYGVLGTYVPLAGNNDNKLDINAWARYAEDFPFWWDMNVKYWFSVEGANSMAAKQPIWIGIGYDASNAVRAHLGAILGSKVKLNFIYNNFLGTSNNILGSGLEGGVAFLFQ